MNRRNFIKTSLFSVAVLNSNIVQNEQKEVTYTFIKFNGKNANRFTVSEKWLKEQKLTIEDCEQKIDLFKLFTEYNLAYGLYKMEHIEFDGTISYFEIWDGKGNIIG